MPSSISASSTGGTALSLSYSYYPNGSVETVTNNRDNGRTATYGYDSLDRINSAASQATSGADCWGQSSPDPYNGSYDVNNPQSMLPLSLGISAKNQITNSGFSYDASGDETVHLRLGRGAAHDSPRRA